MRSKVAGTRAARSEIQRKQRTIGDYSAKTTFTETLIAPHSFFSGSCPQSKVDVVNHLQRPIRIPEQSSDCERKVSDGSIA